MSGGRRIGRAGAGRLARASERAAAAVLTGMAFLLVPSDARATCPTCLPEVLWE